jgi:hypothetical protein
MGTEKLTVAIEVEIQEWTVKPSSCIQPRMYFLASTNENEKLYCGTRKLMDRRYV